jgi:hypothetical protein
LAHKHRREESKGTLLAMKKGVKCRLLEKIVDKRLTAYFVVQLQDIMDVLNDILLVAHGMSLNGSSILDPDDGTMATIMERFLLKTSDNLSLAASIELVPTLSSTRSIAKKYRGNVEGGSLL